MRFGSRTGGSGSSDLIIVLILVHNTTDRPPADGQKKKKKKSASSDIIYIPNTFRYGGKSIIGVYTPVFLVIFVGKGKNNKRNTFSFSCRVVVVVGGSVWVCCSHRSEDFGAATKSYVV